MNAKEKQNLIIKNIIKPILKESGYKNKGNNYRKEEEDFFKLISLQNFSWNSSDNIDFCFNFGILVKDVTAPDKIPENFGISYCHVQLRESSFIPRIREKGSYRGSGNYNIKTETDEIEFGKLIEEDFKLYILKDFDNLKTLDDCLSRFEKIGFWGEQISKAISKHQITRMINSYKK